MIMALLDTILKRRSVREYSEEEIPDETVEKIVQAGLLAPTSRNRKPCELIVVRDKSILKQLSESKNAGSAMLEKSNVAIVVFADSQKADTWIEDSSICLAYMDLMANELGLGSCWCQSHLRYTASEESSEDFIRNLFDKQEKYRVVGVLSLGFPKTIVKPHELSEIDQSKVTFR